MPEKLFTLKELSAYLNLSESEIKMLVDAGIIPAYRIGGSFLRFRKEQIDAIRDEISLKVSQGALKAPPRKVTYRREGEADYQEGFLDRVIDFFHFNDFYIVSIAVISLLIYIITKM